MRYNLTREQHERLYDELTAYFPPAQEALSLPIVKLEQNNHRIAAWNKFINPHHKLVYNEDSYVEDEGYWGYVEGSEKYINWFIVRWS